MVPISWTETTDQSQHLISGPCFSTLVKFRSSGWYYTPQLVANNNIDKYLWTIMFWCRKKWYLKAYTELLKWMLTCLSHRSKKCFRWISWSLPRLRNNLDKVSDDIWDYKLLYVGYIILMYSAQCLKPLNMLFWLSWNKNSLNQTLQWIYLLRNCRYWFILRKTSGIIGPSSYVPIRCHKR